MTMHENRNQMPEGRSVPLLVQDSISMSVRDRHNFPEQLVRILITMLGCWGMIYSIHGFFRFPVNPHTLALFSAVVILLLRGIRLIHPKLGFACILVSFAAVPAALIYFREQAVLGTAGIYDIMQKKITWQPEAMLNRALSAEGYSIETCMRFMFDLLVLTLSALLEYSDVLLTHQQSGRSGFWIRLLVTFPFLECGLYFGLETYSPAVFMLIAFWIGTIAVQRRKPGKKTLSVLKKKKQILSSPDTDEDSTTHEPAALMLLLAACAVFAGAMFTTRDFVRSEELNRKRKQLMQAYENFTLEDLPEFLQKLPGGFHSGSSDEIDLTKNNNPTFDGSIMLRIQVGGGAQPDDYYLRGIVRSDYTGKGWSISSDSYRSQQKLFRRLTAANRMPQTIFHSDHIDDLRIENGKFPVVHCTVDAAGNEKVNYLPYQSVLEAGTKYRYDTETELESPLHYSFWLMNGAAFDWDMFSIHTAPSQDPDIAEYERFVQKQYLKVPDNTAMQRVREEFEPFMPDSDSMLIDKLDTIRDYIWDRAEYTLSPEQTPENYDFTEYFLHGSHEGYCAHYATAAVLLCRMCGIPARYCQGYVMTTSDFGVGLTDGSYRIEIPDQQAHAWAEIYVNGYGWIPYEFTEAVRGTWHRPKPAVTSATSDSGAVTTTTATTTTTTMTGVSSTSSATTSASGSGSVTGTKTAPAVRHARAKWLKPAAAALLLLLLIAFAVWCYVQYHRHVLRKRSRAMHDKDPNKAGDAAFGFLLKLLEIQGIEQRRLTHEQFAEKAEKECRLLPAGKLKQAVSAQQEAVFSREGITAQQAESMRKTALLLAKKMYAEAKPLKKLALRWGRHII